LLLIARRTDLGLTGETAVATVNATLLLFDCATNGHVKGSILLLKTFGADLRAADEKSGATALHEAARAGRREIIQLFIEHVAGPHLNQATFRKKKGKSQGDEEDDDAGAVRPAGGVDGGPSQSSAATSRSSIAGNLDGGDTKAEKLAQALAAKRALIKRRREERKAAKRVRKLVNVGDGVGRHPPVKRKTSADVKQNHIE